MSEVIKRYLCISFYLSHTESHDDLLGTATLWSSLKSVCDAKSLKYIDGCDQPFGWRRTTSIQRMVIIFIHMSLSAVAAIFPKIKPETKADVPTNSPSDSMMLREHS